MVGGRLSKPVSFRTTLANSEIVLRPKSVGSLSTGLPLSTVATQRTSLRVGQPVQVSVSAEGSSNPIQWATQNARFVPIHLLTSSGEVNSQFSFVRATLPTDGSTPRSTGEVGADLVYRATEEKEGFWNWVGKHLGGWRRVAKEIADEIAETTPTDEVAESTPEVEETPKPVDPLEDVDTIVDAHLAARIQTTPTKDRSAVAYAPTPDSTLRARKKGTTSLAEEAPGTVAEPRVAFRVTDAHRPSILVNGVRHPVGPSLFIGRRSKDVGLLLDASDPTVSRVHAEIVVTGGGEVQLRDHYSTTGTYVNDHQVPRGKSRGVMHGDRIRIGRQTLTFEYYIPRDGDVIKEPTTPVLDEIPVSQRAETRFIHPSDLAGLESGVWLDYQSKSGESNPILLSRVGRTTIGGSGLWDSIRTVSTDMDLFLRRDGRMFKVLIHITPDKKNPGSYRLYVERGGTEVRVVKPDGKIYFEALSHDSEQPVHIPLRHAQSHFRHGGILIEPGDTILSKGKPLFTVRKGR